MLLKLKDQKIWKIGGMILTISLMTGINSKMIIKKLINQ